MLHVIEPIKRETLIQNKNVILEIHYISKFDVKDSDVGLSHGFSLRQTFYHAVQTVDICGIIFEDTTHYWKKIKPLDCPPCACIME